MKSLQLLAIAILLTTTAWAQSVENTDYDRLLTTLLDHTTKQVDVQNVPKDGSVTFIDTREKKEYDVSHINGAVWAGYDDFDPKRLEQVDKNAPVVVYCSVGYRSEKVAEKLRHLGYTNVTNLYGGIFEWVNQENPVVHDKEATQNVHAFDQDWGKWLEGGKKVYR